MAATDSLGLASFQALRPEERESRRIEAGNWLRAAGNAPDNHARVRALTTAAGLTPDDPQIWLELAGIWRWAGDYLQTEGCLDAAAAAVRGLDAADADASDATRTEAALETALLRAWLHYDRAEWREGLAWSNAAQEIAPGDADTWRIQGLLVASLGRRSQAHQIAEDLRRNDEFTTDLAWILAVLDHARGQDRAAFDLIVTLRPDRDQAAECWRDMASIAESKGEWSYARRWYRQSRAALPLKDASCLREIEHPRLGAGAQPELPVWLAYDRWFVTGSRSAAVALAFARFDTAQDEETRRWWGGSVVNQAGILMRRDEDTLWAHRARGLVFAWQGMVDRGLRDLRRVARTLAAENRIDARVEAAIGHLLLVDEDHKQAWTHLDRALEIEPNRAATWTDMGLALIMSGDPSAAGEALNRAIALDPNLVTAWYNRGLMHLHAGNHEAAGVDLAEAARLAPDNQEVARLLQQIEAVRRQQ